MDPPPGTGIVTMSTSAACNGTDDPLSIRTFPLHIAEDDLNDKHDTLWTSGNALMILRQHLPVSLPLYRRIQFRRCYPATKLLSNLPLDHDEIDTESGPWLITFVDRSCRPETEVWLFASWEVQNSDASIPAGGKEEHLIQKLLQAMREMPIPESIHQDTLNAKAAEAAAEADNATDSVGLSKSDYAAHMLNPSITLWGSIHERTLPLLQRLGIAGGEFKAAAMPNLMFTWDIDSLAKRSTDLPEGLRWGQLKPQHFPLVRSRTQIPRQDRTLAVLPNLGIFTTSSSGHAGDPNPIAWVFVGLDGSLTTLHVEAEWRDRGLAKAITTKLFREKMSLFWELGVARWAHGYVIRGNKESEGMCRSLGGRSEWDVFWVRVDLARFERSAASLMIARRKD